MRHPCFSESLLHAPLARRISPWHNDAVPPVDEFGNGDPFGSNATLARYEIFDILGEGAFGKVLRARHQITGRDIALKLLKPFLAQDRTMVARFFQEAQAATAIGHPGIVEILDAGMGDDGQPFLAMELLTGQTLRERLEVSGPLTVQETISVGQQLLAVLEATHARSIVHRNLKPDNLFLRDSDTGNELKVLDFGISKFVNRIDGPLTRTEATMGTPHYMAPEQFLHAATVDHRADLYATAAILYECLSGNRPFAEIREFRILMATVQTAQPKPLRELNADVPRDLAHAIDRGLERNPDDRWASAAAFEAAMIGGTQRPKSVSLSPTVALPARPLGTPGSEDTAPRQDARDMDLRSPTPRNGLAVALVALSVLVSLAVIAAVILAWPSAQDADPAALARRHQRPADLPTPNTVVPSPERGQGSTDAVRRDGGTLPTGLHAHEAGGGPNAAPDNRTDTTPPPKARLRMTIQGNPYWGAAVHRRATAWMGRFRQCTANHRGSFTVDVRTNISKRVSSARPSPATPASQCVARALVQLNLAGIEFPSTSARIRFLFRR